MCYGSSENFHNINSKPEYFFIPSTKVQYIFNLEVPHYGHYFFDILNNIIEELFLIDIFSNSNIQKVYIINYAHAIWLIRLTNHLLINNLLIFL